MIIIYVDVVYFTFTISNIYILFIKQKNSKKTTSRLNKSPNFSQLPSASGVDFLQLHAIYSVPVV